MVLVDTFYFVKISDLERITHFGSQPSSASLLNDIGQ